jgi:hypothetical protein
MATEGSTVPKPFVFVLMPFDSIFDDIYKFGIKGAASDVGAYAERLDEQIFTEGMLDRIFNQISKADVIVADMTGRNPNVFYEVGYAHALGKIVLLLTKNSDDIPFDLKHRQHTVYQGSIDLLRTELAAKLQWAIAEARNKIVPGSVERFSVRILSYDIPRSAANLETPVVGGRATSRDFILTLAVRNDSVETTSEITHIYLFCEPQAEVVPCTHRSLISNTISFSFTSFPQVQQPGQVAEPLPDFLANPIDATDGLTRQFRLPFTIPALPPGAVEERQFSAMFEDEAPGKVDRPYRLRLHSRSQFHDYPFRLHLTLKEEERAIAGDSKTAPDAGRE